MSSHLTGSHRRSADHNSRERHSRSREVTSSGGGAGAGADINGTGSAGHSRPRNGGSEANQVKEAIIDLYLKIKVRQRDEVSHCLLLNYLATGRKWLEIATPLCRSGDLYSLPASLSWFIHTS